MKILFCIIIFLTACVSEKDYDVRVPEEVRFELTASTPQEDKVDKLAKISFKLGAVYSLKAQKDCRYQHCETYGEVAELAWTMYKEKNK